MDHLQKSLLNCFSMQPLDREAHLRCDENWLQSKLTDAQSIFYLLHQEKIICYQGQPLILTSGQLEGLDLTLNRPYFLGTEDQRNCFAIHLNDTNILPDRYNPIETLSLRDLTTSIDMKTASVLAYAQLLIHWHLTNKFCRCCGNSYSVRQGGHVLKCNESSCAHIEFPRINPAVIMRVTCDDKILLARQSNWPVNRYSVLAGFVETGETLEHAVMREIKEEAGIDVHDIYYHSSQPWPFPNSLMIGYTAKSYDMQLDIENDDLETAIWLSVDELIKQMDSRDVILSPPISISHRLIEDWFFEHTGRSIKEWQDICPEHIVYENE